MKQLVTGGTGFLGGHLVSALVSRGDDVVAMGRDAKKIALLEQSSVKAVRCDLTDPAAVAAGFAGVDVVHHVAALSSPWGTYRDFHAANVVATQNVFSAAVQAGVRRVVFVSSPSVTFDGRAQIETDETEPYARRFLSHYQRTKMMAEQIAKGFCDRIEVVILRPKAIFGPGDNALLPRLIAAARAGRLRQIGDGTNLVDLTYVGNVVEAMLLAAESTSAIGGTYLITNGEHVALWPVLKRVLTAAGCDGNLPRVSLPVASAAARLMEWRAVWTGVEPPLTRYTVAVLGRTQTYRIDAARRDLGYVPRVSVEAGIERTIAEVSGKPV